VLLAEVREACFGGDGPAVQGATLKAQIGERTLNAEQLGPGQFAFELPDLEPGSHRLTLKVEARGFVFVPRAVTVERRSAWRIWADSQIVAANGTPLDITIRIARDVGARGARVTALVGDQQVALRELADGRYGVVLEEGLLPGLKTVHVRAELPGPAGIEVLDHAIPIYVEPRGWIEVPTRIEAGAGEPVTLEARVRDRMGRVVKGAGLPVAVVVGAELLTMQEDDTSRVYRLSFVPPPGDSRFYFIGLEGIYERRVVSLQAR
jgi:hypothetical protein